MTLHTVMPLEAVWRDGHEQMRTTEIRLQGVLMQVMPLDNNRAEIIRLLDCSLESYLNPSFAPGQIIRYIPTL